MNDKTLGEYKRTTPDPDETTGEALARLQAELTRLLDEADAELRDEADGGVAAALIEKEAEQDELLNLGRLVVGVRDYGHDVRVGRVKIAPCDSDGRTHDEATLRLEREAARAGRDRAERERDEARADLAEYVQAQTFRTPSRPLTPDAITDEMVERVKGRMQERGMGFLSSYSIRELLTAALTEPPARPEGAEELAPVVDEMLTAYGAGDLNGPDAADFLAERGVRVVGEDGAA